MVLSLRVFVVAAVLSLVAAAPANAGSSTIILKELTAAYFPDHSVPTPTAIEGQSRVWTVGETVGNPSAPPSPYPDSGPAGYDATFVSVMDGNVTFVFSQAVSSVRFILGSAISLTAAALYNGDVFVDLATVFDLPVSAETVGLEMSSTNGVFDRIVFVGVADAGAGFQVGALYTVAVPGPVAAAGVPALLTLCAFVGWRHRRRMLADGEGSSA